MKKAELLKTIESLFWEHAFSDLTMDHIAEKIGMKKASLYYHFPSKEAMFLAVLDTSFASYKAFLETILLKEDVAHMISELTFFPLHTKNLFAVVLQKGYCQMTEARESLEKKRREIQKMFENISGTRFGWSPQKTRLFVSLIESLSKQSCLENCEREDSTEMVSEIQKLFFEKHT